MIDEEVIRGLFATYGDAGVGDWLVTWLAYPHRRDRMEGRMRSVGKGREFDGHAVWAQILKRQADEQMEHLNSDITAYPPIALREVTMRVLGAKLVTFIIGRKSTRWTVDELNPAEGDRLVWTWRIIQSFKNGPYPWDDVTIRTWFMGMNPRLGPDHHNNPATFIREGHGEEVLRAAKGDYFDGSMGA